MVHRELAQDIRDLFKLLNSIRFPLRSVLPIAEFEWNDDRSMEADNSTGFNYREIAGKNRLSQHAFGKAIDLNPRENPCITSMGISPIGAKYDPAKPGTIVENGPIVRFLEGRGWTWGGRWNSLKDYQHFEKTS